jgi:hypothetical protein
LINPNFSDARFYLGAVYLTMNKRSAAIKQYSKMKTLTPELADKLYQAIFKNKLLILNIK